MSLSDFHGRIATIGDVLATVSLLGWDMRTMMPSGGSASRGRQIASLVTIARDLLLSDGLARALDGAERQTQGSAPDAPDSRALTQVRQAITHHKRLPSDLIHRRNLLKAPAQAAWAEARAKDDFAIFAPLLAQTVNLAREEADCLGYDDHPHDALLAVFEPGVSGRTLAPIFAELRAGLKPLIRMIGEAEPQPPLPAALFAIETQHRFAKNVAARFGYDFTRGRLDQTVHPFETAMTRDDVRITGRYATDSIATGLKAAMHEAGHGLYEQNVDPVFSGGALALDLIALSTMGAPSLGAHESQSRLWENHVGRSRGFWQAHFPLLREAFPQALQGVDEEDFYRAFNRVSPGTIRVEADELTYDFHIMLRLDLERALLDGDLSVADLPAAWNEGIKRDLDVDVPSDAQGVLQDIHWSLGLFGSFASYTIGNIMAAQIWDAIAPTGGDVALAATRADYAPLRMVLAEKIYRHGRRYSRDELVERVTGQPLSARAYVTGLRERYGALYGIAIN